MVHVIYECGCTAGGDLISPYCPFHTNMPIVKEFDNTTTKKQEMNIMEQRNNNTELHDAQEESIRLMQENASSMSVENQTMEARLMGVRKLMTFTRAKKTIRRTGWYFTEPYAPCGSAIASPIFQQAAFGTSRQAFGESGLNDKVGV